MLTFGSLFAGIGGFDLGFERAGIQTKWSSEIDENCNAVRRRHWPNVRQHGDVRAIGKHNLEPVDILTGGFPCQDLSVAGKRAGLDGERSGLWFEFHRILSELKPEWVVIENVPGLLSSQGGRDFAVILRGLVELRYGVCWRVLDSQNFGVPQRRRRVFIVGHLGDGRAAEILFERESGAWDFETGRAGPELAATLRSHSASRGVSAPDRSGEDDVNVIAIKGAAIGRKPENGPQRGEILTKGKVFTLNCTEVHAACQALTGKVARPDDNEAQAGHLVCWSADRRHGYLESGEVAPTLQRFCGTGGNNVPMVDVRRLTPTECERLQGFPDDWTAGHSDSARYRMLGNAVTVNVAEWLGHRVAEACGDT